MEQTDISDTHLVFNTEDDAHFASLLETNTFHHINEIPWNTNDLLSYLVTKLEPLYRGKPTIVSFVGGPASGKSTISESLIGMLNDLGHPSDFTSTDAYSLDSREERNRKLREGKTTPLTAKDFDFLNTQIITKVKIGESVRVPEYNEANGDAMVVGVEKFKKVIPANLHFFFVEGDFQPIEDPDFLIYVHVPMIDRCELRVARDRQKRSGYGDDNDIRKSFYSRIINQYMPYTIPSAQNANVLLMTHIQSSSVENSGVYQFEYTIYEKAVK